MRPRIPLVAALGFACAFVARADEPIRPGFDCTKARTETERTICATPELSRRDRDFAILTAKARRTGGEARRKAQGGKEWIARRDACGSDVDCIGRRYDERIADILNALPAIASLHVPVSVDDTWTILQIFPFMTPDDLQSVTTGGNRDALAELSCRYFERSPHDARRLFASHFGSSRDGWQPLCERISLATDVPEAAGLIVDLDKAFGATTGCDGTISHAYARDQSLAEIMAVVDARPEADPAARDAATLDYRSALAGWAEQGLAQKRLAAAIEARSASAVDALKRYYVRHDALDLDAAERVARYNVARIGTTYIGRSGASGYCSARAGLDRFLASGDLQPNDCAFRGSERATRPVVLHDLLGVAIVDDYPIDAIRRLVDAGAAIDATTSSPDPVDTPLMRAVERTDVLSLLLKRGADPNRANDFGKTALMYAVAARNAQAIAALITAHADVNASTKPEIECTALKAGNRTVLMYAAWHATPQIVSALIAAGAQASAKDTNGDTAKSYVAKNTNLTDEDRKRVLDALNTATH